jgi:hypothetical protein
MRLLREIAMSNESCVRRLHGFPPYLDTLSIPDSLPLQPIGHHAPSMTDNSHFSGRQDCRFCQTAGNETGNRHGFSERILINCLRSFNQRMVYYFVEVT